MKRIRHILDLVPSSLSFIMRARIHVLLFRAVPSPRDYLDERSVCRFLVEPGAKYTLSWSREVQADSKDLITAFERDLFSI